MKLKALCTCYLLAVLTTAASAQGIRFANQRLQRIAETLQADYGMDCTAAGTTSFGQNRIRVAEDSLGRICHIGLELFPENIVRENPSPVYAFVERYLLELYLWQELPSPAQRLAEDKVLLRFVGHENEGIRENIARHLPRFRESTSLMVLTDNHRYSLSIYENQRLQLSMRFPIRYELLWGMNKIEAENKFYEELLRYRMEEESSIPALSEYEQSVLKMDGKGCAVLLGDSYLISSVNSNRFYRLDARGEYVAVYDRKHAAESVSNLFQLPDLVPEVTVSVKQRLYKRRTLEFEVSLQKLLAFCRKTGCQTFVGIETCREDSVTGTAILLNPSYGYFHQIYFQVGTGVLDTPERVKMKLELYAFVPTHNIENLFYEKEEGK